MRFPIKMKKVFDWSDKLTTANLSDGLISSLCDMGIMTFTFEDLWQPNQRFYDLPIEDCPLLSLLTDVVNLEGDFHIGCTADYRPPWFQFYTTIGLPESSEGEIELSYLRELKLSTFFENNAIRNRTTENRELIRLANLYNISGNYSEGIKLYWSSGLTDKCVPSGFVWYSPESIELTFIDGYLTSVTPYKRKEGREIDINHPHLLEHYIFGTKWEELKNGPNNCLNVNGLNEINANVEELLEGLIVIVNRIYPNHKEIDRKRIKEVSSHYSIPPRSYKPYCDFDYIHEKLGGYFC
jgi:hypothetical protein